MDCMEAKALKPSLRREISMKSSTQQAFFEDVFWCSTVVPGEDFPIDDLLDFSNEDFPEEEEEEKFIESEYTSLSTSFSDTPDYGVLPADELSVPVDDLENLEWLSRFVDDSGSEFPVLHVAGEEKTGSYAENRYKPGSKQVLPLRPLCLPLIPAKAAKPRTKRPRPAGRVWSLESPSLSESSSSSSSLSGSSSPTACVIFNNTVQTMDLFYGSGKPPVKKQKKKPAALLGETGGMQFQRRCSHCQVNKTPQWRTGPHGAKTLCNACGVRFKSGRLYPEYRPACSPTFSGDLHSNSHRKVLEMRRKKETGEPDSGLAQMVLSC